jgi:ubiquinone/menaquinone biosynthesis C-methylase UbiE
MDLLVAKALIQKGIPTGNRSQVWADLGAGNGLFTKALSILLPANSQIVAIDHDARLLHSISISGNILLNTIVADLNALPDSLPLFDGVVMANSLHYVRDQHTFLKTLRENHLKPQGHVVVVEYDLEKSNPWVPYPLSKKKLSQLASECKYAVDVFPNSVKSRLNSSEIYAALLKPHEGIVRNQ